MELATITLYKTLIMVVLALVGVIGYKTKVIDKEINKHLSNFILTILTPILLFTSFQKDFNKELLAGLLYSALLSVISFGIIWIICKIVVCRREKDYAIVEHIALMYSNCGFIGIPMAQGLFGTEGVFYMTAYVALANFLLWSHGIVVMSGKTDLKSLKKVFTSPTILSIILGIICFVIQIRLPQIIEEPLEMIADMNTPMAMIVAGANIAQADLKHTFKNFRLYWLSSVKLIVIPMAIVGILYFVPTNEIVKAVMILASACPVGVTGSLFALQYGKDAIYASELFAMSTIISIVTVPFMMLFC